MLLDFVLKYVRGTHPADSEDASKEGSPSAASAYGGKDRKHHPPAEGHRSPPDENVSGNEQGRGIMTLLPKVPSAESVRDKPFYSNGSGHGERRELDGHEKESSVDGKHRQHRSHVLPSMDMDRAPSQFSASGSRQLEGPHGVNCAQVTEQSLEVHDPNDGVDRCHDRSGTGTAHDNNRLAADQIGCTATVAEELRAHRSTTPIKIVNAAAQNVEDDIDDDNEVVGNALVKPMTPQSYSSLMFNSDFRKLNYKEDDIKRRIAVGEGRSLLILQNRGVSCDALSAIPALERHVSDARSCPARSVQSSECAGGVLTSSPRKEEPQRERNFHSEKRPPTADTDGQTICTCGLTVGSSPTEQFSCPGGAAEDSFNRKTCKIHGTNLGCRAHSSELISEWVSECIPPEPVELINVNAGRPRVNVLKKGVINCCVAVRKSLDDAKMMLNNKYVIYFRWCLGVGSSSKVFLCYNLHEKAFYAMKVYNRGRLRRKGFGANCALNNVRREIDIMKKLRHPNILSLVEVIDDPFSRKIYLVLELAEKGAVMTLEGDGTVVPSVSGAALPEEEVARAIRSVVEALIYVHDLGIVHRDVKPQNILLDAEECVKLSDFGVSIMVDGCTSPVPREGTVAFLPPEMLASSEVRVALSDAASHKDTSIGSTNSHQVCSRMNDELPVKTLPEGEREEIGSLQTTDTSVRTQNDNASVSVGSECKQVASTGVASLSGSNNPGCEVSPSDCAGLPACDPTGTPVADFFKADVFALGVTTFVLLMGRLPWLARSSRSQMKAINAQPDPFEEPLRKAYGCPSGEGLKGPTLCNRSLHGSEPPESSAIFLEGTTERTASQQMFSSSSCGRFLASNDADTLDHHVSRSSTKPDCTDWCNSGMSRVSREDEVGAQLLASSPTQCAIGGEWKDSKLLQSSEVGGSPRAHEEADGAQRSPYGHTNTSMRVCCGCRSSSNTATVPTTSFGSLSEAGKAPVSRENKPEFSAVSCFSQPNAAGEATPFRRTHSPSKFPLGRRSTSVFVSNNSSLHSWRIQEGHQPHAGDAVLNEDLEGSLTSDANFPLSAGREFTFPLCQHCATCNNTNNGPYTESGVGDTMSGEQTSGSKMEVPERRGLPETDTHKCISADAIEFVRSCLRINPMERSTMKELYEMPWLQKGR
ncbi:protein kinase, putative [Trypanosoma equiperdum]|uniref:Protein kinase, putative n=2 Tax=Trypanozoon TaxID=39700 RepID=Q387Y1_TRYB2|nr:protein kinase, putative [Trypanosoma brucei brucei TREU927]EAN78891.1 protein kinase, putative [Trypanosoma brucei brucei TREU927]SCU66557.1 protein kinase, putative [Trypanosoma equiperdum]